MTGFRRANKRNAEGRARDADRRYSARRKAERYFSDGNTPSEKTKRACFARYTFFDIINPSSYNIRGRRDSIYTRTQRRRISRSFYP